MMVDKQQQDVVKKLEKEFKDFQKEWKKFLTNDFAHLATDVKELKGQNNNIQEQLGRIESATLELLGARAYDWSNKGTPATRSKGKK